MLRCPICDGIILRIVETDEATYVDARGAAYLRFERRESRWPPSAGLRDRALWPSRRSTLLGEMNGDNVWSAIRKQPVAGRRTVVAFLAESFGDGQADLDVHGGPDKAVYAYPSEHLATWR